MQLVALTILMVCSPLHCAGGHYSVDTVEGQRHLFLQQFASTSSDDSAMAVRVERVELLAEAEHAAVDAQQEAFEALAQEQQHLAARMDAIEALSRAGKTANPSSDLDLCPRQTEATCLLFKCGKELGNTRCESGACYCAPGFCADGHGRCMSKRPAHELSGLYKIGSRRSPDNYLYMSCGALSPQEVRVQKGDPGKKGLWRVVVNNDDSIMLYTEECGPQYRLSIEDMQEKFDNVDKPIWRASYTRLSSLWGTQHLAASFEIYDDAHHNVFLKHARTGKWLEPQGLEGWTTFWGSGNVTGVTSFPGLHGALTFDPPLTGVKMLRASASRLPSLFSILLIMAASLASQSYC